MSIVEVGPERIDLLLAIGPGLFDHAIRPDQARAFLASPLNVLLLACEGELAVGMATGTVLLHPDQPPVMFVNEVGTRETHQRQGVAEALMRHMLDLARARGCEGLWLGTEPGNAPALGLYRKLGGKEVPFIGFGWDEAL